MYNLFVLQNTKSQKKEPFFLGHYDTYAIMTAAIKQNLGLRIPNDPIPEYNYSCDGDTLHLFPRAKVLEILGTIAKAFDDPYLTEPKWIDCHDKMPEINTKVICLLKDNNGEDVVALGYAVPRPVNSATDNSADQCHHDWIVYDLSKQPIDEKDLPHNIKAWMPMPTNIHLGKK
ncbi:MAG: DUF551 domain-containing protein [Holophagaceae bacterium]|nr:DUF551 domain-containing protein [Holophagaceae bacterium]